MRRLPIALLLAAPLLLTGCDMLGIETASALMAKREGEGKAVGGACRHAGRAIEDCYALNKKAEKSAVFAGWREMNDYMRENKLEAVVPQLPAQPSKPPAHMPAGEDTAEDANSHGTKDSDGHSAKKKS